MDFHPSAFKHGLTREDIVPAARDFHVAYDLDEENPGRQLRLGFSPRGSLLELVVLKFDGGGELVIHAMKARREYRALLPGRPERRR